MKISEVLGLTESRTTGKMSKRHKAANKGATKFRDPGGYDRTYELNRLMMTVAGADGVTTPSVDAESWAGKYNTVHPYTEVERKMLKTSLKALGSDSISVNDKDTKSRELDSTHKVSPMNGFKGYKRR